MNIVIATSHLPYPTVPHGGGQDLMALIRFLGERHAVRVVAYVGSDQVPHAGELAPYVADLCLVHPAVSLRAKWVNARRALRRGDWRRLGQRAVLETQQAIAAWAAARQADVLLCVWTEMGRYLATAPAGVVRVLDEVDVRFVVEEAEAVRPRVRRPNAWRKAEELAYCRAADLVLARSQRDLAALQAALPQLRGRVLPPVALSAALLAAPHTALGEAGRILFVGALDREPNARAARWLADDIWPMVRAAHPAAQLRLVGANPTPAVQRLGERPGITVTGYVADLLPEYAHARVVVTPMLTEGGAFNKVMDALAAGRPLVTTPLANAGVAAPAEALCAAADARSFARAIIHLLGDDEASRQLGAAARRFATRFDWRRAAEEVEVVLEGLVAGRGKSGNCGK